MMNTCDIRRLDLEARSAMGEGDALEMLFEDAEPRLTKIARFRMPVELRNRVTVVDLLSVSRFRTLRSQSEFVIEAGSSSFLWFRSILLQTIERMRVRIAPRCDRRGTIRSALMDGMGIASLNQFTDEDIEILFLRHVEELTLEETATVMGIVSQGLSLRYIQILNQICDAERSGDHLGV